MARKRSPHRDSSPTATAPRQETRNSSHRHTLLWLALLVTAAAVAFSTAVRAPFVFDDIQGIAANPSIRQLLPPSVPLDPPHNTAVAGRPVVNLTLALNYWLNERLGVDPQGSNATLGYHLFNILVHTVGGLLLFAVVRRSVARFRGASESGWIAGVVALLWIVHPIHTGAVDYVIQRSELIVSALYLATVYCSIRAWEASPRERVRWMTLAVIACAVGMASKEVMITAPLMVLLYDRAFIVGSFREAIRERGRFYAALGATMLIVVGFTLAGVRSQSVGFDLGVRWYEYLYTQAWAIPRYVRLLFWPRGLTFDYGDAPIHGLAAVPGLVLLVAAGIGTLLAWRRESTRWLGFLGAWFFLLLAPSSSVIPISTEIAAERRVYLASAAIVVLAVIAADALRRRARLTRLVSGGLIAVAAASLTAVTVSRGTLFRSTETLYRDVIAKSPKNARGYVGVGLSMFASETPRLEEAVAMFRQAVAADSTSFVAWHALGVVELSQGPTKAGSAAVAFEHAVRIAPGNLDALAGLVTAYIALDEPDRAIPHVLSLTDARPDLVREVGKQLVSQRRGKDAIPLLEAAVRAEGATPTGFALLGLAYAQASNRADAITASRWAASQAANDPEVLEYAGRAMVLVGQLPAARDYFRRALVLAPESATLPRELEALGH